MKKKIIIMMLLMIIAIKGVNAACNPPVEDPTPGNNRTVQCDLETTAKTTKFVYPEPGEPQVIKFDNKYCVVTCKEEIVFAYPSVRRTYAGLPFSYTLNLSAQRACTATYPNYVAFDELYRELVDMYMVLLGQTYYGVPRADINHDGEKDYLDYTYVRNKIATFEDIDNNKVLDANDSVSIGKLSKAITNMKQKKDDCDNWGTNANPSSTYEVKPTVNLTINTSKGDVLENYEYEELVSDDPIMVPDETTYSSCVLNNSTVNGRTEYRCTSQPTYIGWTELARVNGRFVMKEKKMVTYQGNALPIDDNTDPSRETCWAGRKYYVSLTELTKPRIGDNVDQGYPLTLTVSGIGNNIENKPKTMNLTVNCFYQVRNLIGPTPDDYFYTENLSKIPAGSTNSISMYLYRTIDLNDPFPNKREPGANWVGDVEETINGRKVKMSLKEKYITSTANTIQNKSPYKITLSRSNINYIKRDTAEHGYNLFELPDDELNEFVRNYYEIITPGDR